MNSKEVSRLVASQLSEIERDEVRTQVEKILIEPFAEFRDWDYGNGEKYECWVFAKPDKFSYFVYCDEGFGPSCPWGIVSKKKSGSIGPDGCWYSYLEDLYYQTGPFEGELPKNYEVR